MNLSRYRAVSFSLVSLVAAAAYAQEQLPEKEEDIPVEFVPRLDDMVKVGVLRRAEGPKVHFGNLGVIPMVWGGNSGNANDLTTKFYSDGAVYLDQLRAYEQRADGSAIPVGASYATPNWISKVNNNGTVTVYTGVQTVEQNSDGTYVPVTTPVTVINADGTTTTTDAPSLTWGSTLQFLQYKPGQTRTWSVNNASQIDPINKTVSMSSYGAVSTGQGFDAQSKSGNGFQASWEHKIGQRGHFEWGFSANLSLSSINAQASGVVVSTLQKATDVYHMVDTGFNSNLFGTTAVGTIDISQPGNAGNVSLVGLDGTPLLQVTTTSTSTSVTASDGTVTTTTTTTTGPSGTVVGGDQSSGTPLSTTPDSIVQAQNVGSVYVQGTWAIKGAYYNTQFGPTFRYRFNDRWAISGSAGLSVTWVGTVFKVDEVITTRVGSTDASDLGFDPTVAQLHVLVQDYTRKFVPGYYGNLNAEYWVTERTGFYFGMSFEQMGHYYQRPLSGRTATVELGKTSGWQLGIMTRF